MHVFAWIDCIGYELDDLIVAIIDALEGVQEVTIVRNLLRIYRGICRLESGEQISGNVDAARAEVLNVVNNFFFEKMTAHPNIKEFVEGV